jgi:hypothetical protein
MKPNNQLQCFVVMGFGTKTDFATGRKLDLDYSYNALIKPVVEQKGITCIRADEIKHSGAIDVPMYQQLLNADVVIADLSTSNANAFYELGIRHALRPHTTIVIAEQQMSYPFDLNHILISKYNHLGLNIDYYEVLRFQKYLGETLDAVIAKVNIDSPVYTFLDNLTPPVMKIDLASAAIVQAPVVQAQVEKQTLALLVKQGEEALVNKDFTVAKKYFALASQIASCTPDDQSVSSDAYLIQRLSYATYKAAQPDLVTALKEAIDLLLQVDLKHTNDPETVVLGGKIEKRLYYSGQGEVHLQYAILNYQRCYYLLNNRYHGINLSFLLNVRVASNLYPTKEDKISDMVWANRIRKEVLRMCERDRETIENRKYKEGEENDFTRNQKEQDRKELGWILVNKAESQFGLGEMDAYKETLLQIEAHQTDQFMLDIFKEQMTKLRPIMQEYGHLLNPAWKEDL